MHKYTPEKLSSTEFAASRLPGKWMHRIDISWSTCSLVQGFFLGAEELDFRIEHKRSVYYFIAHVKELIKYFITRLQSVL